MTAKSVAYVRDPSPIGVVTPRRFTRTIRLQRPQSPRWAGYECRTSRGPGLEDQSPDCHASDAMLTRYVSDGEMFMGNATGALL